MSNIEHPLPYASFESLGYWEGTGAMSWFSSAATSVKLSNIDQGAYASTV